MKTKITLFSLLMVVSYSSAYKTPEEFCKNINKEAKKKVETPTHKAVLSQMAHVLLASKDCSFIQSHYQKPDWALIDARDKASRKATGTFPGAVKITSDHHNLSKHKFKKDFLVKKLGKHFAKQGRNIASLEDLKNKKLIIFCNGVKCYRSSWAACSLHKMGFKKENLYLVLDGYDGLKHCLK